MSYMWVQLRRSSRDTVLTFRPSSRAISRYRSMVQGEIGWNIDTEDWRRPGADTIASRIKSAGPGEVILMHDGGGDRSQTVAALREALPYLKSQGYKFVTISELIEAYPYQEGQHS